MRRWGASPVANARTPARSGTIAWALAPLVAALVATAACASPGATPAAPSPTTSRAAAAPTTSPAALTTAVAAQTSAVVHLSAAAELEQLRGRGQPVMLAVLDRGRGNRIAETDA